MVWVAALVVFGPGLAVLAALGVRERLVLLGASPAASVGVALLAASFSALFGGRYGVPALIVTTVVLAGVGYGLYWAACRFLGRPGELPSSTGEPLLPELAGYLTLVAQLLGLILVITGGLLTLSAWYAGLGSWSAWNQDHDPILHALLTAYIMRTGHGAPWQIMPADVVINAPTVYYPDGFHLISATIADVFGNAVTGMDAGAAMILGAAWVASAGSLAGVAVRRLCAGQVDSPSTVGWSSLGAGVGAVIAAGLYRPGLELARDNGLLPNASALVLVPGVLTAILLVRPKNWTGAFGVGIACAGVVAVHPSSGLSAGLSILVIWLAMLCGRFGRATLRAQLPVLGVVLAGAALVGAPVLHGALAVSSRIQAFPPDSNGVAIPRTLGAVVPLVYGGMFDNRSMMQVWPTLLLAAGVITVLRLRRAVPLLVCWVVWVAIVLLGYRNPRGATASILGFFYNSVGRVQSNTGLFAPALATAGVFGLLAALLTAVGGLSVGPLPDRLAGLSGGIKDHRLVSVTDRLTVPVRVVGLTGPRRLTQRVVAVLGVAVLFGSAAWYLGGPTHRYLQTNATALSQRWRYPQLYRVDGQTVEAADWLRARVRPGERIMNSPNDGSSWLYVHDGLPIVELSTLGVPGFRYTWRLLKNFQDLALDSYVREEILRLNIAWVYLDSRAPIIGASGAPDNWTGGGTMMLAPGLTDLDDTPGLTLEHGAGSVHIYHVDQDAIRALDMLTPQVDPELTHRQPRAAVGTVADAWTSAWKPSGPRNGLVAF